MPPDNEATPTAKTDDRGPMPLAPPTSLSSSEASVATKPPPLITPSGPFLLWTADATSKGLQRPIGEAHPFQDPTDARARRIIFSPNSNSKTPPDRTHHDVCHRIDRTIWALNHFYRMGDAAAEARFRPLYAKVFDIGQKSLEAGALSSTDAVVALDSIEQTVLQDEWARVEDEARHQHDVVCGDTSSDAQGRPGPYLLWTTNEHGEPLNKPADGTHPRQDRHEKHARDILFSRNPAGPPPGEEDFEIYDRTDRLLHVMRHLYKPGKALDESQFRWFYDKVFGVARNTVEATTFSYERARKEFEIIERDLIEDEGPKLKTNRVIQHLKYAAGFAGPLLIAYVALRLNLTGALNDWLVALGGDAASLATFMLLLVGALLGVCVSFAIRKPGYKSVNDLVVPESDHLSPLIRLGVIGALTSFLVMFATAELANISIGQLSFDRVLQSHRHPFTPFLVGLVCGLLELTLPTTFLGRMPSITEPTAADSSGTR